MRSLPDLRLKYIRNLFAQEDALLHTIDKNIRANDIPIHIGPEEGKLIGLLLRLINAEKVVEIGTLAGYSTIWIARSLVKEGVIYTIEKDPVRAEMAASTFKEYKDKAKINLLQGDASNILNKLTSEAPFDAVFIDADKVNYPAYLDWAEENLRTGGLIIADNSLLSGAVYLDELPDKVRPKAKDAMITFNERMADESKFYSIIVPTSEGLTVGIKLF